MSMLRKSLHKNKVPRGLVGDTNMAAVPLFRDTKMAAMTSRENTVAFKQAGAHPTLKRESAMLNCIKEKLL